MLDIFSMLRSPVDLTWNCPSVWVINSKLLVSSVLSTSDGNDDSRLEEDKKRKKDKKQMWEYFYLFYGLKFEIFSDKEKQKSTESVEPPKGWDSCFTHSILLLPICSVSDWFYDLVLNIILCFQITACDPVFRSDFPQREALLWMILQARLRYGSDLSWDRDTVSINCNKCIVDDVPLWVGGKEKEEDVGKEYEGDGRTLKISLSDRRFIVTSAQFWWLLHSNETWILIRC